MSRKAAARAAAAKPADSPPSAETPEPADTADDASVPDDSPSDDSSQNAPAPPTDAAGWRSFLHTLPAKDLLRILQQDKGRAMRLLMGFRPGGDALRHPIVMQRMVEEAVKQAKFAEALWEIRPKPALENAPAPKADVPAALTQSPPPAKESDATREALKRQRAAIKEKEARITELEAQVAALTKERDAARADTESARNAQRTAEAEAERHRRQRERDVRRDAQRQAAKAEENAAKSMSSAAARPLPVAPPAPRPFEEAVRRLLNRGKYTVVAEAAREALQTDAAESPAVRGTVHALFAAALYGMGDPSAEEQDRLAVNCLLDGGQIVTAAEAMARLFTQAHSLKAADAASLRRLLLLAERTGDFAAVQEVFTRMRIGSAEAGRRLRQALGSGGKKASALLEAAFGSREGIVVLGPDEAIALPVTNPSAASVTPRRLARAIDTGDAVFIADVRAGLASLRTRGGSETQLADALLEAVTAIEPVAVAPLLAAENHPILVDASNVARHNPDPLSLSPLPKVANLLRMRDYLLRQGFFPVLLIADANLRYHVDDREQYRLLVDRQIVRETPPGTSADETLLREARSRNAPLITNDRFNEWGEAALGIERHGFLINAGRVALTES